jgi:uncharacterized protein Yka (UPF0111/DUF47 family)
MTAKTRIVDFLGDKALVLPALLDAAILGNERAKYVLSLLQMAATRTANVAEPAPSLKAERLACGISEAAFDRAVAESESDGRGAFHIPGARRLVEILDQGLEAMLAPVALAADSSAEEAARHQDLRRRLDRLVRARSPIVDDVIDGGTIAAMTSGRPAAGDGVHLLVMDLHKEIARLQAGLASAEIAGAKCCGITAEDRPLIAAFMRGVARTAPLKFDHPGLGTTGVRSGGALLIENDIGTTEAHVLVVRVTGLEVLVTHTDIHLPRLQFFRSLIESTGIAWEELSSQQSAAIPEADIFYVARGHYAAPDAAALGRFLEQLGSRLVFLIDWNKARKRLGLLVPNEKAVAILRWAADHDFGHRGFLTLGGERLVYDALEQAVKTPLRYGEPLHEMIGTDVAEEYLRYVLQTAAAGLRDGQSEALIRDQVRAELFNHFRSAEQRLLVEAGRHAAIVARLATGLQAAFRAGGLGNPEAMTRYAAQAKEAESRADEIVRVMRSTVRRIAGTEIFRRLVEIADDAADDLEDAAFLSGLLARAAPPPPELPAALLALADLLVEGAQAFGRALDVAQRVHRGGAREDMQHFLEAVDRVATTEHRTDERERAVTIAAVESALDSRHFYLITRIAGHLESAADALSRATFVLRDHVLGEVMFV